MDPALRVGTSGWIYKSWAGTFYPPEVRGTAHLPFYARHFNTVEINATHYRLPPPQTVAGWRERAPPGFLFAVKGSRFITHMKKLRIEPPSLDLFFERIAPLGPHLGPILWQLPPMLHRDLPRLERFLGMLPEGFRHAVEFRHPSWLVPETFALLHQHRCAHVWVSSLAMPMDLSVTADFLYLRFHGLAGGFAHDYTEAELAPWVAQCRKALREGLPVHAYFNNDGNTRAPENARLFVRKVLRRRPSPIPAQQRLLQEAR